MPDIAGMAGVVVVLMEEDNVSDSGAIAGYNALVNEIQQRLNVLIPLLGFTHQDVTDDDIEALQDGIDAALTDAIQLAQSGWQNLWSWLNADDQIGSKFFSFGHDALAVGDLINFSQRWRNEGDWEIFGHANASVVCPASAAAALSASHKSTFDGQHLRSLRKFRNNHVIKDPSLVRWWGLAERNSAALSHLFLTDAEARKAVLTVLPQVTAVLSDSSATIPDDVVAQARVILKKAASSPSRQLRSDAARAADLVALVPGWTVAQAVALAGAIEPKRANRSKQVRATAARIKAAHSTPGTPPVRPATLPDRPTPGGPRPARPQ